MSRKGRFIIVDGIAGSGKSTVLKSVHAWAEDCDHRIFHLSDWESLEPPTYDQVRDNDVFFTYEPTRTWVGSTIRYELSREDNPYGGEELAHAFALDRQIMYRRLIIPALEDGKTIIQDRGVSSSLVYQPIMPNSVPLETIIKLPGNQLALEHAPNALILATVTAQVAHERIQNRDDDSKGVFANPEFLKKLEHRFKETWFRELFESRGTSIFELDTGGTLEDSSKRATNLVNHILTTC